MIYRGQDIVDLKVEIELLEQNLEQLQKQSLQKRVVLAYLSFTVAILLVLAAFGFAALFPQSLWFNGRLPTFTDEVASLLLGIAIIWAYRSYTRADFLRTRKRRIADLVRNAEDVLFKAPLVIEEAELLDAGEAAHEGS